MKAIARHYRGIEFVSLHELPVDQQTLLLHNTEVDRIKILVEEKIVSGCIQYKHYCAWYESVFEKSIDVHAVEVIEKELFATVVH